MGKAISNLQLYCEDKGDNASSPTFDTEQTPNNDTEAHPGQ